MFRNTLRIHKQIENYFYTYSLCKMIDNMDKFVSCETTLKDFSGSLNYWNDGWFFQCNFIDSQGYIRAHSSTIFNDDVLGRALGMLTETTQQTQNVESMLV